jgi:4'-phosphopantetheinyl transferase
MGPPFWPPATLARWEAVMPPEERAGLTPHAAPAPARRQAYVLGRLAARRALLPLVGAEGLGSLCILPGVFGQPVLVASQGPATRLGVSLSHRNGVAVAVAFEREHPMGVDIEMLDPAQADTLQSQELPGEVAAFTARPGSAATSPATLPVNRPAQVQAPRLSPLERATLLWSCKEALGKAMGCGLTVPPEFLAVASAGPGPALELPSGPAAGWRGSYRHSLQFAWQAWRVGPAWLTLALPQRSEWQAGPMHPG